MPQKIRVRSLLLGVAFTLFFIGLVTRLYWLQVVDAAWLTAKAEAMWESERPLPAKRGTVYDRNMQVLAGDGAGYTVVVNPKVIHEFGLERDVSSGLGQILGKPEHEVFDQVTSRDSEGELRIYREVRNEGWKINEDLAEQLRVWEKELMERHRIEGDDWPGVSLIEQQMRYYPKETLAAHVLGYVDKDGTPRTGLELAQDELLRGTPGSVSYQRDRRGQKLPEGDAVLNPPVDGKHLVLTIDQTIQHYTESAMRKVYERFQPKSMTALAIDPRTMEVLALANYPTYDPNQYWEYDPEQDFRNMAVQSRYEPGSTFKLVTLTAAVNEHLFHPNATFMSGSIRVPGQTIHDHRRSGWGEITYLEGLLRSSNVAFVKLGYETLGEQKLLDYIDRFGFTGKTGIDLPGEVEGYVRFRYPADVAAGTYGQGGVLVTPLQQLVAYASIANGGTLMKPYIIKKVIDPVTKSVISEYQPEPLGQIVEPEVARQISEYLEQVVADQERGTGHGAYLDGYRIAGKTGTANKVIDGKYSLDKWVFSFIGYAPVEDPRIAVAVIADEPDLGGNSFRGGEVAVPVFKEIVSKSLRYLNVPPEGSRSRVSAADETETALTVPDLSGLELEAAKKELEARGFVSSVLGDGSKVLSQYPAPGEQLSGLPEVYLLTVPAAEAPVPNLKGESLRDVIQLCALLEIKCKPEGEGYVVDQRLTETPDGMTLHVTLQPMRARVETESDQGPNDATGSEADDPSDEPETENASGQGEPA